MRALATFATLAVLATAQSAAALSCAPADVFRTLEEVNLSTTKSYTIWHGDIQVVGPVNEDGYTPMAFTGTSLLSGDAPVDFASVLAKTSCIGTSCGQALSAQNVLAFIEIGEDGQGYLSADPCSSYLIKDVDAETMEDFRAELRGILGQDEG